MQKVHKNFYQSYLIYLEVQPIVASRVSYVGDEVEPSSKSKRINLR